MYNSSSHKVIPINEGDQSTPIPSPTSPSPDGNLSQIELTESRLMQHDIEAHSHQAPPDTSHPNNEEAKSDADSNSEHNDQDDGPTKMDHFKAFKKRSKLQRFLQRFFNLNYYDIKLTVRYLMESFSFQITISVEDLIMLITIFVLFSSDIIVMTTPAEADAPLSIAYFICFIIFAVEFLVNTWCKTEIYSLRPFVYEGYLFSFFWWLDLISTLSLIPDIDILAGPAGIGSLSSAISGSSSYTQAGRVVRLVRLVRLVRVYRIAAEKRARAEHEEALVELARIGAISWDEVESQKMLFNQRQSRLGKQLSESITRRVIVMILILLIIIPVLIYSPSNEGPNFGAIAFKSFNQASGVSPEAKKAAVDALRESFTDSSDDNRYIEKLYMSSLSPDPIIYYPGSLNSIRDDALLEWKYSNTVNNVYYYTEVIYSLNYYLRQIALYDILTTIFVAIMMIGGAVIFSNDAEQLVIKPIERMVTLVEAVAQNPLGKFEPFEMDDGGGNHTGQYETKLLETTVGKITGLLRVGFGEAGAGIISANLSASSGSATINPLLPGLRIYAIFGFCDIHQFEDINQKLSNDVLIFVNTIADIVHNSVHGWSGQVNKNLGNAFVVVWRIGDEVTIKNQISGLGAGAAGRNRSSFLESTKSMSMSQRSDTASNNGSDSEKETDSVQGSESGTKRKINIDLRRVPGVDRLADHALIGYLKIIAEINRNRAVLKFRHEPRLTDNGKHEYKLRMGFGLHAGWAIEGAVGSIQKVDATYLSPHVNMAARLETSSRQYGVPLLASHDFYELLSTEAQSFCRRVDKVTVKGSEMPIEIYTYDCLQEQDFKDNRSAARSSFGERGGVSRKSYEKGLSTKGLPLKESPNGTFISANNTSSHGISAHGNSTHNIPSQGTPPNSGTSSPQRRPSMQFNQVPGSQKTPMFLTPEDLTADVFDNDYDLATLRQHVTPDFIETFKAGVTAYLNGEWLAAKELLERADSMMLELAPVLGGDGPSKTLLSYMKNRDYKTPGDWKGFRPLTSK